MADSNAKEKRVFQGGSRSNVSRETVPKFWTTNSKYNHYCYCYDYSNSCLCVFLSDFHFLSCFFFLFLFGLWYFTRVQSLAAADVFTLHSLKCGYVFVISLKAVHV